MLKPNASKESVSLFNLEKLRLNANREMVL